MELNIGINEIKDQQLGQARVSHETIYFNSHKISSQIRFNEISSWHTIQKCYALLPKVPLQNNHERFVFRLTFPNSAQHTSSTLYLPKHPTHYTSYTDMDEPSGTLYLLHIYNRKREKGPLTYLPLSASIASIVAEEKKSGLQND